MLSPVSSYTRDGRDVDDASYHTVFFLCAVQSLLLLSNPRSDIIHFSYCTYFHAGLLCPETMTDSACLSSLTDVVQMSFCSDFGLWHSIVIKSQAETTSPCFEIHQKTCWWCCGFWFWWGLELGRCCCFSPHGPLLLFHPTVWTRVSLLSGTELSFPKYLIDLIDISTWIHSDSIFLPHLHSKAYCPAFYTNVLY